MATYRAIWSDGTSVTWRDLTYKEYRALRPSWEVVYPEDLGIIDCAWALDVYKTCLEIGPDPDFVPFGIVQFVAQHQLIDNPFSGQFKGLQQAITAARDRVSHNYMLVAKALISSAFHYKMEEIDEWPADIFFTRLAQTEILFGQVGTLVDPNAKPEPPPQPRRGPRSPAQTQTGTIGDDSVPKSHQRGAETQTYTVTSKKYPQR